MYVLYEPSLVGQMYFSSGYLLTKEYSWSESNTELYGILIAISIGDHMDLSAIW